MANFFFLPFPTLDATMINGRSSAITHCLTFVTFYYRLPQTNAGEAPFSRSDTGSIPHNDPGGLCENRTAIAQENQV
jgi:hypothetical protein